MGAGSTEINDKPDAGEWLLKDDQGHSYDPQIYGGRDRNGWQDENGVWHGGYNSAETASDRFQNMGDVTGARSTPGVQLQTGQADAARGEQSDALGLQKQAAMGNAPSRAEILGKAMTEQSLTAQQSAAASSRGGPLAQAAAQRNAAQQAAGFQQNATTNAMAQRADEMANARGAYFAGASGQRGQDLSQASTQAGLDVQQRQLNEQRQEYFEGLSNKVNEDQLNANLGYKSEGDQAWARGRQATLASEAQDAQNTKDEVSAGAGAIEGAIKAGNMGSDERMKRALPVGSLSALANGDRPAYSDSYVSRVVREPVGSTAPGGTPDRPAYSDGYVPNRSAMISDAHAKQEAFDKGVNHGLRSAAEITRHGLSPAGAVPNAEGSRIYSGAKDPRDFVLPQPADVMAEPPTTATARVRNAARQAVERAQYIERGQRNGEPVHAWTDADSQRAADAQAALGPALPPADVAIPPTPSRPLTSAPPPAPGALERAAAATREAAGNARAYVTSDARAKEHERLKGQAEGMVTALRAGATGPSAVDPTLAKGGGRATYGNGIYRELDDQWTPPSQPIGTDALHAAIERETAGATPYARAPEPPPRGVGGAPMGYAASRRGQPGAMFGRAPAPAGYASLTTDSGAGTGAADEAAGLAPGSSDYAMTTRDVATSDDRAKLGAAFAAGHKEGARASTMSDEEAAKLSAQADSMIARWGGTPAGRPKVSDTSARRMKETADAMIAADQARLAEPPAVRLAERGTPESGFNSQITAASEPAFRDWMQRVAPGDDGGDYDYRGAFAAGLDRDGYSAHFPDTFKKPNHETFSDESQYAKFAPQRAGRWEGERYIPPKGRVSDAEAKKLGEQADAMAEANRSMAASAYSYKPGFESPGQAPGEVNVGPMAQNMAANPVARTAIVQRPDGLLAVDKEKALKLTMGGLASLQDQVDDIKRRRR